MMKKYLLTFVLITLTAGFSSLQAAAPVIDSPATDTVESGQAYSYDITTALDDALIYNATGLPAGLSLNAATGEISGTPTVSGVFTIKLAASNADGTGRQDLVLTITDPGPSITSPLSISVNEGSPYTYTITASNNPTGFSLVGEGVMDVEEDPIDRSNVSTNGTFQFTPSAGTAGNTYNLLIGAENDAGSSTEILVVEILPATGVPAAPTATVLPAAVDSDYPGTTTSISVSATVTVTDDGDPSNGSETIDTVFVRWLNPPNRPDGTERSPIILTALTQESGTDTYSGIVNVGFDPDNRQLGGGDINLEIVAYQSNSTTLDNYASAPVNFTIAPLVELLFPGPDFDDDSIASGAPYATARLSSGLFKSIRAKINGSGISYTAVDNDPSDNTDGIFNFRAPELIDLPGTYSITVTAVDTDANETVVTGGFSIPEPLSIALSRSGSGDINQGGQVTFEALVSPLEEVSEVEFFDSGTGTSLGQGVRVTREGRTFFQFNRSFPLQGNFGTFATATTFDGQSADSSTLSLSVLRVNDAQVSITSPVSDQTIILGETVSFTATASASPGIVSISWLVDDLVVETEASSSSSFDFVSGNLGNYGPGSYTVTATALDGFGNVVGAPEEIVVTVIDGTRRPIFVAVGENFSYQIIGVNNPSSFTLSGLDTIPTDSTDTSNLASNGEFSFTPSPSAEGNTYTLLASASNGGESSLTLLSVEVVAPRAQGAAVAAGPADAVYPGTTTSIPVSATITPLAGESVDTVFVRWLNPPNLPDGTPREPILLTDLTQEAGTNVYSGTVNVGFNPDDRQLGGGDIELEIGAYQSNSTSIVNYAADTLSFTIAPLIEFLFPDANFASDAIARGDVFASARVSTQQFASVRARIVGGGIAYTDQDVDASDNSNGIFNFTSPELIDLPGNYAITITAVDTSGNETVVSGGLLISDTFAGPVAEVSSPSPGFRTEVFSAAVISVDGAGEVVIVSSGQGYYPRNTTEATLGITLENGTEILPPAGASVVIENGRIVEVGGVGGTNPGSNFIAVIDLAVSDPGIYSRIPITAEFFQANTPLKDFRILLDGKVVKSGTVGEDVPLYTYPQPGEGSPKLGEHVVVAQVTDEQGEVGTSLPLSFSIVPYEPLVINLTRTSSGDVNQGEQVTFEAEVSPLEQVTGVEFFDSDTGDSLGQGSRVTRSGRTFYRLTRNFPQQGNYGTFAIATSFDGRTVSSSPVRFSVLAVNDGEVTITNPIANQSIVLGEKVSFSATASASPGIVSIDWLVNNVVVRTVNSAQATFEFASGPDVFDEETGELVQDRYGFGTYTVTATAEDAFGNVVGAPQEIVVTVGPSDLSVSITSPTTSQEVFVGEQITFNATASSSVGVAGVEWFIRQDVGEGSSGEWTSLSTDATAPYTLTQNFTTAGTFSIRAEASDNFENRFSSGTVQVTVKPANPLLRDENFVTEMYERLIGISPTNNQFESALAQLDGTLAARSQFVADLLQSDAFDTTKTALLIYRTMTGEWPDSEEADQAIADLFGASSDAQTFEGFIFPFGTQTFPFSAPQGAIITATATGNPASAIPHPDPDLTIFDPNGNFIAFDDFSGPGFDPAITFSASIAGEYSIVVSGWFSTFGDFILTVNSSSSGGTGIGNPNALVQALVPEYQARFGALDADVASVTRLFRNKHAGTSPTPQALNALFYAATENFSESLNSFIAAFAVDNDVSKLSGPSGLPLTTELFYERPNNPEANLMRVALIARLLGAEPTDAELASLAGLSLTAAVEKVLTDPRFIDQFDASTLEGQVVQYMAGFGLYDPNEIGPNDDPDGDGFTNAQEMNAGTDPMDGSDFPAVPMPASSSAMVQSTMQSMGESVLNGMHDDADGDGLSNLVEIALGGDPVDSNVGINLEHSLEPGDSGEMLRSFSLDHDVQATAESSSPENTFVLSFVRLKESARPEDMLIVVECSTDLLTWDVADPATTEVVLAVDQSGLGDAYERVQYRVVCDPAEQGMFFRVAVRTAP